MTSGDLCAAQVTSEYGAFLDPVADKLLVCVCLVLLSAELGMAVALPTAAIVGREVTVSALREWAAGRGQRSLVAVGSYGKLKTAVQMLSLTLLMLARPGTSGMTDLRAATQYVGIGLLYVAAVFAGVSAYEYAQAAWPDPRDGDRGPQEPTGPVEGRG